MKKIFNEKGITMIALVVTIIVILIIVGVSISSITGQGNTINKANDVQSAVDIKEEKDAIRIAIQETIISSNNGKIEKSNLKKHLDEHLEIDYFQYNEENEQYTIRTKKNNNIYIIDKDGNFVN